MTSHLDPATPVDDLLLRRLLLTVEATYLDQGWNHPPELLVLYDRTHPGAHTHFQRHRGRYPATIVGRYAARALLPGHMFLHEDPDVPAQPWDRLRNFAMGVAWPTDDTGSIMRELLTQPGVVGFAFVNCAYELSSTNIDRWEAEQVALGQISIMDRASVDVRKVFAADLGGRIFHVTRRRGAGGGPEPAEVVRGDTIRGDITISLRILADAVTGQTPPLAAFKTRYRSLHDTTRARRHFRNAVHKALRHSDPARAATVLRWQLTWFDRDDPTAFDTYQPDRVAAAFAGGPDTVRAVCAEVGVDLDASPSGGGRR